MPSKKRPTRAKAKKMLSHGSVRGKKLTKKQRGYFGAVASGKSKNSRTKRK